MVRHLCAYCEILHDSTRWWSYLQAPGCCFYWCNACHVQMWRMFKADEPHHPAWLKLKMHLDYIDHTGCPISSADSRHDVQAVRMIRHMCSNSPWRAGWAWMFLVGFTFQLYFVWPSIKFAVHMLTKSPYTATRAHVKGALGIVKRTFRGFKVRNGLLVVGPPGKHILKNPSERRLGEDRLLKFVEDMPDWRRCCQRLAAIILRSQGNLKIRAVLDVLSEHELKGYSGSVTSYASVRFARLLIHAADKTFADTEDCWTILRNQSPNVHGKVMKLGLWPYERAIAIRNAIRARIGQKNYSFSDMIVYICLAPI